MGLWPLLCDVPSCGASLSLSCQKVRSVSRTLWFQSYSASVHNICFGHEFSICARVRACELRTALHLKSSLINIRGDRPDAGGGELPNYFVSV